MVEWKDTSKAASTAALMVANLTALKAPCWADPMEFVTAALRELVMGERTVGQSAALRAK
jgi:hypothetical protein